MYTYTYINVFPGLTLCTCAILLFTSQKFRKTKASFIHRHSLFRMSAENFHFYIKVRTTLNIQSRIIHDELNSVYGDQASSLRTVERWLKLFRDCREDIEDKPRPGRPITETTFENIEQFRLLINDDPYLTLEQLEHQTDLSHGTIHRMISDH